MPHDADNSPPASSGLVLALVVAKHSAGTQSKQRLKRQPSFAESMREAFITGYIVSAVAGEPDKGRSLIVGAMLEFETEYPQLFARLAEEGRLFPEDDEEGSLQRAFDAAVDEQPSGSECTSDGDKRPSEAEG